MYARAKQCCLWGETAAVAWAIRAVCDADTRPAAVLVVLPQASRDGQRCTADESLEAAAVPGGRLEQAGVGCCATVLPGGGHAFQQGCGQRTHAHTRARAHTHTMRPINGGGFGPCNDAMSAAVAIWRLQVRASLL